MISMYRKIALAAVLMVPAMEACSAAPAANKSDAAVTKAAFGHIDAKGLKALMDTKIPMELLDARKDKYFYGDILPGAKRLPSDSTPEKIKSVLPSEDELIIAYCAGEGCDASKNLVAKLIDNGYTNVIEFHGGEREWKAQGYDLEAYVG
jgi:rhodanese-related sulfurtransferase